MVYIYIHFKEGQTSTCDDRRSLLQRVATTTIYKLKKPIEENHWINGMHFDKFSEICYIVQQ